ncbi:Antibiotic biosynthesis monooxygenase [Bradyrhizobium sp. STM 3843]|uniref:antibiotic biosynthesis monooxygenase family protein n=1 Tax=Bradyrhizobium sp. STM 3843 TaxID=551947 RepID=UPI000240374D|nr:antibiotic biosynthesis monooxygenase [Bradyrhizobium sp. STM 3843]CCE11432.1 Antibiotic biosynthesis monooxygenase [Bradyrhizobium sp. STM 3843]
MFCFAFEVLPAAGKRDEYLGLVQHLKPILETIDGYIESERFESRLRPGWMLSIQTWRDEKSVVRWRTEAEHHAIQVKGRFQTFEDYHIRGGEVIADTNPPKQAPIRELRLDETEVGLGKFVTFTEVTLSRDVAFTDQTNLLPARLGLELQGSSIIDYDVYDSIYNPGKIALVVAWTDAEAASQWSPRKAEGTDTLRHRTIRIVRDYGRFDRREAPQFYPDVECRKTLHVKRAER